MGWGGGVGLSGRFSELHFKWIVGTEAGRAIYDDSTGHQAMSSGWGVAPRDWSVILL